MVSNMIEVFYGKSKLGGYNNNQMKGFFCGVLYEIVNEITREAVVRIRFVEELGIKMLVPLSRYQLYEWVSTVHLLPWRW